MCVCVAQNANKFKDIEDPEHVADIIGISAIVIADFSAKRIKVLPNAR